MNGDAALQAIMDAFHQGEPEWGGALSGALRGRLTERFFRILHEKEARSAVEPPGGADEAFRGDLARRWREDAGAVRRWIAEDLGLRHWSFSARSNRIQMVFLDAVYDGDVDHRL